MHSIRRRTRPTIPHVPVANIPVYPNRLQRKRLGVRGPVIQGGTIVVEHGMELLVHNAATWASHASTCRKLHVDHTNFADLQGGVEQFVVKGAVKNIDWYSPLTESA